MTRKRIQTRTAGISAFGCTYLLSILAVFSIVEREAHGQQGVRQNLTDQLPTDPSSPSASESSDDDEDDLLDLDLDQLGKVDAVVPAFDVAVTSVTRSTGTVGKSPAAITVLTQDMIRRSGATSIPEALRMVPGMQVARISSDKWAISARGFNDRFANKLLVMVDGRSVYNSLFSGVYWETIDVLMEDIDRIEIIRGPGATLWGANAVNGVINIITKKTSQTQGTLISAGGGNRDRSINSVRYGGQLKDGINYKIFGKQFDRDSGFQAAGSHDDWRMNRIGMRIDGIIGNNEDDQFMLSGNLFEGATGETSNLAQPGFPFTSTPVYDNELLGGHLLGQVTRQHSDESSSTFQFYYDKSTRHNPHVDIRLDVFDLDFSQRFRLNSKHAINWGVGYRRYQDFIESSNPFVLEFTPNGRKLNRTSAFIQDEIALRENVTAYLGSKFSHNDFTGFEVQPSARVLWSVSDTQVAWASVSRAVRTPARTNDVNLMVFESPAFLHLIPNSSPESENLAAYELGYREQINQQLSWDANLFFNHYTDVRLNQPIGLIPGIPPTGILMLNYILQAKTMGVETSMDYQVSQNFKLHGWYSFFGNSDVLDSPANQAYLSASWDLPCRVELDLITRYTDTIPEHNVDSYIDLDLRLGWRPNQRLGVALIAQNLLDSSRPEFPGPFTGALATENKRGIYAQMTWRY